MYLRVAFLGCSLGSIGGGPEKDGCFVFGFWALSIAPRGYALLAGDPLVLLSPSLHVSRTSSCPRTVQPNMLLPPLEDIVWLLTENKVRLEVLCDLPRQPLEQQFSDKERGRLLVMPDLTQGHSSNPDPSYPHQMSLSSRFMCPFP